MDITTFTEYLNVPYMIFLILGGYALTNNIKGTKFDKYKRWLVFLLAMVLSLIFIGVSVYDGAQIKGVAVDYLITYVTATSLYELAVKYVIKAIMGFFNPSKELDDEGL